MKVLARIVCLVFMLDGEFSVQAEQTFRPPVQWATIALLLPAVETKATLTFSSMSVFWADLLYDITSVKTK